MTLITFKSTPNLIQTDDLISRYKSNSYFNFSKTDKSANGETSKLSFHKNFTTLTSKKPNFKKKYVIGFTRRSLKINILNNQFSQTERVRNGRLDKIPTVRMQNDLYYEDKDNQNSPSSTLCRGNSPHKQMFHVQPENSWQTGKLTLFIIESYRPQQHFLKPSKYQSLKKLKVSISLINVGLCKQKEQQTGSIRGDGQRAQTWFLNYVTSLEYC